VRLVKKSMEIFYAYSCCNHQKNLRTAVYLRPHPRSPAFAYPEKEIIYFSARNDRLGSKTARHEDTKLYSQIIPLTAAKFFIANAYSVNSVTATATSTSSNNSLSDGLDFLGGVSRVVYSSRSFLRLVVSEFTPSFLAMRAIT
jgi:hypothetical protein